jgi:hypothetical protein
MLFENYTSISKVMFSPRVKYQHGSPAKIFFTSEHESGDVTLQLVRQATDYASA